MPIEMGEARDLWSWNVWQKAEAFASNLKSDREPFYVVYAAKQDKQQKQATFRESFRFYRQKPPRILGILVWYVDHCKGIFELVPELSVPPDVPIDPALLSKDARDAAPSVMKTGEQMKVILS